jgi:hypothetical protein
MECLHEYAHFILLFFPSVIAGGKTVKGLFTDRLLSSDCLKVSSPCSHLQRQSALEEYLRVFALSLLYSSFIDLSLEPHGPLTPVAKA